MKNKPALTHKRLTELLRYEPESGKFIWLVATSPRKCGDVAGGIVQPIRSKSVVVIGIDYKLYQAHRLAWFWMTGNWPKHEIDHIDGDSLNNRWSNLRECTRSENEANRGPRKTNKLGIRGVSPQGNKFVATIFRRGKRTFLGRYSSIDEAKNAYLSAAAAYDGDYLYAGPRSNA